MTKTDKQIDYSKLFNLLDEQKLKNIGTELATQAMLDTPIEYEEFEIKLKVPKTVVELLETLTEVFPVEMEAILSKMASQGLGNILQGVTSPSENEIKVNPLDNMEPMNKISDQLSDLQSVINRFSDMQKIFEGFTNGANINSTKEDEENP